MSAPSKPGGVPVTGKQQLVEYFLSGCKPKDAWRIGTEHEKFAYRQTDFTPLPYEAADGPGVADLLAGLCDYGWTPILEGGRVIALSQDGASVTLEPGGQVELSGAPLINIHQTCDEVHTHLHQVKEVASRLGIGLLGLGVNPKWPREAIPWMPKGRYEIMKSYMPTRGTLGLDMMLRTCTVQVNLDYESEADMVAKMRVGMALQPVAVALFANSPFLEGKPSGYLSYRSHIWTDTDSDRCGILPFVFEPGMSFERYVDYLLDMPMYFVYREGRYLNAAGQSFRDFMEGRLPVLPGEYPTLGDWEDHISTAFPEVRLKKFIEMRGADGGPWRRICALPAFWVGLLYDAAALDDVSALVSEWTLEDHETLRRDVPRQALATPIGGRTLRDVAGDLMVIAEKGLGRRNFLDGAGNNETGFLLPLQEIVAQNRTPAEELLELYKTRWNQSVDPVFTEYAY